VDHRPRQKQHIVVVEPNNSTAQEKEAQATNTKPEQTMALSMRLILPHLLLCTHAGAFLHGRFERTAWDGATTRCTSFAVSTVPAVDVVVRSSSDSAKDHDKQPRRFPFLGTTRLSMTASGSDSGDDLDDDVDDDEEELGPLSRGIDSVDWLPNVQGSASSSSSSSSSPTTTTTTLPLFPLGSFVYTPNSEHRLNIFEPRYRQMYSDILMNGSKRFVVSMSHPIEPGQFASMGVLFELDKLQEVSEQTNDAVKFICDHKVTRRVKIHRIINPEAWETRKTYLKTEATILPEDDEMDEDLANQKSLLDAFVQMVDIQHELEEDVRFTKSASATLAIKPGAGENGLWRTINLWQKFVAQRFIARQQELERDFQEKLQNYLKREKGLKPSEFPSIVGFQDLPQDLKTEVVKLQKRMASELRPLMLEAQLTMQKMLECENHTERLQLARLRAKKAFQGMFTGDLTQIPKEEQVDDDVSSLPSKRSFFVDDDDAFQ
jgi:Lon protease-like protein